MTRRARLLLSGAAAAVAAGLLAAGVVHLTGAKGAGLPVVGQVIAAARRPPGPHVSGTTLTGGHLDITSWRGHVVVINFWGSWCVPCRKEAPVLRRVAGDTRSRGVHFVGIDIRDNPAAGLAFERQYHIPYPSISDPGNLIAARFGTAAPAATPSTYILDGSGRIAWAWFGATTYAQLELAVTEVAPLP
jgi:thiol-disulfide isomerase/thioredoxin